MTTLESLALLIADLHKQLVEAQAKIRQLELESQREAS